MFLTLINFGQSSGLASKYEESQAGGSIVGNISECFMLWLFPLTSEAHRGGRDKGGFEQTQTNADKHRQMQAMAEEKK